VYHLRFAVSTKTGITIVRLFQKRRIYSILNPNMSVTILDIAREAGVSKSTVSLVINNSQNVKAETRCKVEQTIERLGYVPNMAARQLIMNRTHTLGLIFLTSNHFNKAYEFSSVPETLLYDTSVGINTELTNTEYTLLTERFSLIEGSKVLPRLIKERRLDGVFLVGGLLTETLIKHLKKLHIPLVLMGSWYKGLDSVFVDLEQVGYLGVDYLLQKGHRNVLFVNGPESSPNSILKAKGAKAAFQRRNLNLRSLKITHSGYAGSGAREAISAAWEKDFKPSAIFCGSDGIAGGVMHFLYEKALRIPDDVSVLSYEYSLLTEYASPSLTSIDIQKEILGKEACRILLNRINKPTARPINLRLPPILIERNSVRNHP
jgi:LacI family transcriptional regulator/LacI family purine nucleotide synthesis repressor